MLPLATTDVPLDSLIDHQINDQQNHGIMLWNYLWMHNYRYNYYGYNYAVLIPPWNYAYDHTGLGIIICIIMGTCVKV